LPQKSWKDKNSISDKFEKGGSVMREKLEKAWMKVGKFIFWALVTALCCCLTYMVFAHRKANRAAIKGEPLPEPSTGKCCHNFCKKK
jgi:hypothetical protein